MVAELSDPGAIPATTVADAVAGDAMAFARIVRAHHDDMARVCQLICGDAELAQDAAQAAWPIAWRKLGSLRDPDKLRPWLVSIAANEARQMIRRLHRDRVVPIEVADIRSDDADPAWRSSGRRARLRDPPIARGGPDPDRAPLRLRLRRVRDRADARPLAERRPHPALAGRRPTPPGGGTMTDAIFEARLERAAQRIRRRGVRPIDAVAIATAAMRIRAVDEQHVVGDRSTRAGRAALAAIATLVIAVVGISFLLLRLSSNVGPPSPSPSPSPTDIALRDAAAIGRTRPRSATAATWLADQPANLSFGSPSGPARMAFTLATPDMVVAIDVTSGPSGLLRSVLDSDSTGNMLVTTIDAAPETQQVVVDGRRSRHASTGDEGHYDSTASPDGMLLTLTAVSEDCPSRQAVFARTWSRSLGVPGGGGGVGVVDAFEPLFTVDLPNGNYSDRPRARRDDHPPGLARVPVPRRSRTPRGSSILAIAPRDVTTIAPGADSIVAYFRQLAGFTVDSTEELTVDGLRAVKLVVHANDDASCPDGRLWEWQPKAETSDVAWFVHPGVTDSLYIVEHPKGTLMFEVLPAPNPLEEQVIGTIHFLDALPTSP